MYMLTEVIKPTESATDPNIVFMYDVACVLETNIRNKAASGDKQMKSLLEKISFAIPAMHAYGHKIKCQVNIVHIVIQNAQMPRWAQKPSKNQHLLNVWLMILL